MPEVAQAVCTEDLHRRDDERRLRVRYASDLPALCQRTDAEVHDIWLRGKISDVSVSGVRLVLNRPFMANSLIVIEPFQTKNVPPRVFEARVVYAGKHETGGWIMGCEFTEQLTQEEMQSLLENK
jgi:hypothetical protein